MIVFRLLVIVHDHAHTLGIERLFDCEQLVLDNVELFALACENGLEKRDLFFKETQLFFELAHFEFGKALQAHIQNRLCLRIAKVKSLAQSFFCFCRGFRLLDDFYHFVDIADCNKKSAHDFRSCLCGFKVESGAIDDDFALIFDIIVKICRKAQLLGLAVGNRHHIDGISHFKIGFLEKERYDFVDVRVTLAFDDCTRTRLVRLVHYLGYACKRIFVGFFQIGNP